MMGASVLCSDTRRPLFGTIASVKLQTEAGRSTRSVRAAFPMRRTGPYLAGCSGGLARRFDLEDINWELLADTDTAFLFKSDWASPSIESLVNRTKRPVADLCWRWRRLRRTLGWNAARGRIRLSLSLRWQLVLRQGPQPPLHYDTRRRDRGSLSREQSG